MFDPDFLDELVAERAVRNPGFPATVESCSDPRLARRHGNDAEFSGVALRGGDDVVPVTRFRPID